MCALSSCSDSQIKLTMREKRIEALRNAISTGDCEYDKISPSTYIISTVTAHIQSISNAFSISLNPDSMDLNWKNVTKLISRIVSQQLSTVSNQDIIEVQISTLARSTLEFSQRIKSDYDKSVELLINYFHLYVSPTISIAISEIAKKWAELKIEYSLVSNYLSQKLSENSAIFDVLGQKGIQILVNTILGAPALFLLPRLLNLGVFFLACILYPFLTVLFQVTKFLSAIVWLCLWFPRLLLRLFLSVFAKSSIRNKHKSRKVLNSGTISTQVGAFYHIHH